MVTSQNAPTAKKTNSTVQTQIKFKAGKVSTGDIGTGVKGIRRMQRVNLLAYATAKHDNSTRMGFADAADLLAP